jgi:hypothetical protein
MQTQGEMGFFKSLFDFNLTSFITMRVIRVIYAILTVIVVIAGSFATLAGILMIIREGAFGLLYVILAPLGTLLYLILVRLWVEFLANLYRIGDNTQKMVMALPRE